MNMFMGLNSWGPY